MNADERTRYFARTAALAAASTIVITASFIGVLALLEGEFSTLDSRIPWYLVATSLIFLSTIFLLEEHGADGIEIIAITGVVTVLGFIMIVLAVEGVNYARTHPEDVFVDRLVLYFLAAGMFGTGIGYWGIKHWREFTGQSEQTSSL
ncbi:hypothetical protein [Salinarchaeum laminariae]|uniref:hypothetical protein n=1 Tax=Salinarchaeum laminariae TaxID=869888 RepID=UPI0020BDEB39|nr:hypothetical protein [Salinarchaeum laminariae]